MKEREMEKRMVLLDEDRTYATALSRYLMAREKTLQIEIYSDPAKDFPVSTFACELLLFTEAFRPLTEAVMENTDGPRPKNAALLCGVMDASAGDFPTLYKFQSMDRFMEQVRLLLHPPCGADTGRRTKRMRNPGMEEGASFSPQRMIGLYAPVQQAFQLPYALFLGRQFAAEGKTLLIDMEENCVLPELLGREEPRSLTDYLYLTTRRGKHDATANITDFLGYYGELAYLPPVKNPSEISFITEAQWSELLQDIRETDFETVLLLFDRIHQGFTEMALHCGRLEILTGQDGLSARTEKKVLSYLEGSGLLSIARKVTLPRALGEFPDGEYPLEELSRGKLYAFARHCFEEERDAFDQ